jgi:hypothetical protein
MLRIHVERKFYSDGPAQECPSCGTFERKFVKHQEHSEYICENCFVRDVCEITDIDIVADSFHCPQCNWTINTDDADIGVQHHEIGDGSPLCNDCFISIIEKFDLESEFKVDGDLT